MGDGDKDDVVNDDGSDYDNIRTKMMLMIIVKKMVRLLVMIAIVLVGHDSDNARHDGDNVHYDSDNLGLDGDSNFV